MRVLHFSKSFSPTSETFVYDYVTELERQGADNHVVTFRRKNPEERPFPKIHVVDRPSWWHPRRLWNRALVPFGVGEARTSDWPQTRERLAAFVRRVQPDVIHAHFGPAGILVSSVAESEAVPLVVTFYGFDISLLPDREFWRDQYKSLWSRMDAATVLSEEMKEAAHDLGCPREKLNVVHLSRDLEQFPFSLPSHPVRRILFVGRLVSKKAPLDAIRAVERANEQGAGLTLDMVGDGPLSERVRRYVQAHDLVDTIVLHGRQRNAEVAERMQTADAFLLPSKTAPNGNREGTPTVLVEAQATGLPCVTTRHAGIPEMIPEAHHDLVVPEGNVVALADALCTLATRPVDDLAEMAKLGRQKVEQDFNLSGEVKKLSDLYISC